ncbi:MAG: 6-hydroxymethylpterin diphosphokinase MptE-like protein [Campylobacterota bacterium]
MRSIEEIAIETYEKNLDYFAKEHKTLSKQILAFNAQLENQTIVANYDLEYLDTYFDIKELRSGYYLYSGDSNHISEELTNRVNYKKDSFTFEGFPIQNYSKEKQKNLIDKEIGAQGVFPIMNYYIEHSKRDDEMKYIHKYIFIGVGLGLHIEHIHKKIHAHEYLIVEDDIELFRLSMFTTKYYKLGEKTKLFFAIASDTRHFSKIFINYLNHSLHENRYLKYSHFPSHSKIRLKDIQNTLSTQPFVTFPYKTMLKNYIRPLEYMNDDYSIINISKHLNNTLFTSKPVLVLTAGPSFQKNIEFIKNNHKKFIIIAVSAVLKTLYSENIKPDIIVHIDGFEASLVHLEEVDTKLFLKDTLAVLSPISPPKLRELFTKEQIFYYQLDTDYVDSYNSISTPCVGSFSLLLSLLFNTTNTYILGLDLALDQKTGLTHSSTHKYNTAIDLDKKDEISQEMGIRKNILSVPGNFTDTVYTTSLFKTSIQALQIFIPQVKSKEQNIFNLSDGAYIEMSEAVTSTFVDNQNYEDIDKIALNKEIKEVFKKNSTSKLDKKDATSIKNRLENALVLKNIILKYKKNITYTNTHDYLKHFYAFISKILTMNNRESVNLTVLCDYFIRYSLPMLTDLLNSKNIKNEKQHLEKIDRLIVKELLDTESIYENALKEFIKNRI